MENVKRYRRALERQFYKLVCRDEWAGGDLPTKAKPLFTPLKGLVLSYSEQKRCKTQDECKERVKELQQLARKEGKPDTQFNFLVGGDGYVYEAMGWHHYLPEQVEIIKDGERLHGRSIEVAFIDKHTNDLTETMQRGLSRIITMGLTEHFLIENFSFYCRNDKNVGFLYGREKAKERRKYMETKRKQRRDPNYKKEKRQRLSIDIETIKKESVKLDGKVPNKNA